MASTTAADQNRAMLLRAIVAAAVPACAGALAAEATAQESAAITLDLVGRGLWPRWDGLAPEPRLDGRVLADAATLARLLRPELALTDALRLRVGGGGRWTFAELSIRWVAGPLTIAVGCNFTRSLLGDRDPTAGPERRRDAGTKAEFAAWWSF